MLEACRNVAQHAYDRPGELELVLSTEGADLVVRVVDQGIPLDERHLKPGHGIEVMRAFADELRFLTLGIEGKAVEIRKRLHARDLASYFQEKPAPLREEEPVELRLATPDDAAGVARCVYRSYGYTYLREVIYHPERLQELMRQNVMLSAVAVTPRQEVVGHAALLFDSPQDRVPECGEAVTDPLYRGHSLFSRLKELLMGEAARRGMLGIFSECVTVHPYTQQGSLKLGAHETGVQLAASPASVQFKAIEEGEHGRTSVVLTYLRVSQEPERPAFAPERHVAILRKIAGRLELKRTWMSEGAVRGHTWITSSLVRETSEGYLSATRVGEDFARILKGEKRQLLTSGAVVLYLDLRLSDPGCPAACAEAEKLGFSFAGVIPEKLDGDLLRLQYLDDQVAVEPEKIATASDWGRELLDYVLKNLRA